MPLISGHLESAMSAVKSRFGYHQPPQYSEPPESALKPAKNCSSPDLILKSAARDNNMSLLSSYKDKSSRFDDDDGETASNVGARSFEFREDPSFWKDHNVQVIIRIRPLSGSEISVQGNNRCVKQDSSQSVAWTGHPESRFTFDLVADETVSQEMLFRVAGVPMVENCVEGYNSCMFAYGQTGSGKTHTMLGDIEGGARRHNVNCGMTPRVFDYLFSRIQKERDARSEEKLKFTCRCSFLEIYNEQIFDLLDPSTNNLQIREDSKKGVYVENLTEIEVTSARDVIQQLIQGAANRKVAATNMNRASSRSHSVFTCAIESKWESQGVTRHRFARLNLVDLAGSERQKSSGAEGERLKEATNINKSLSTLGLVIMNLVNMSNGKSLHVPYRDSKLTFLLQDSLGGNAKTIIIANITPSSCCSLETLSTLKFAQRAKFIKNHAIVNEDASGDVLALRLENQNLKKEVSRLRNLVNGGGENQDGDILSLAFPGSPGPIKWDGLRGLCSPLASERKSSRKKDYEVALVGALRREKDKDIALQALAAESQAAVQLAKQREDEIQSLKMRLRFREAGIKRLETVASGKISAEDHLLKEREEYMKEIEVLRAQLDRNPEATRFAMENLRLNKEIRRLKSFYEDGERESMLEQISVLENKLLEALDWKLMHESEPANIQKKVPDAVMDVPNDDDFLSSNQLFGKEPASPWRTSMNEEIEFLRIQAIQNQSEIDSLRKKLDLCIQEKENLERRVNDLTKELEAEKLSKEMVIAEMEQTQLHELPLPALLNDHVPIVGQNDQTDIKTMVDAIAAASEREAEAHERAISMSKENDELRSKLKVLIEDNNKLIDLYESAVADNSKNSEGTRNSQGSSAQDSKSHNIEVAMEEELNVKAAELENLKHQLAEMHEENDKLLGLYEKAMQERDELKRVIASDQCKQVGIKGDSSSPEKLVQIDEGQRLRFGEASPVSFHDELLMEEATSFGVQTDNDDHNLEGHPVAECSLEETCLYDVHVHDSYDQSLFDLESKPIADDMMDLDDVHETGKQESTELIENLCNLEGLEPLSMPDESKQDSGTDAANRTAGTDLETQENSSSVVIPVNLAADLNKLREKLVEVQEKLSHSVSAVHTFRAVERPIVEVDALMEKIGKLECSIQEKQQESAHLKSLSSELQARKDLANNKLSALRQSLTSFSSSLCYFEQREALARSRLNASTQHLSQKKEELARLQVSKKELTDSLLKLKQTETELQKSLENLKLKVDEANKKLENDKVLFAIDNNVDKPTNLSQRIWQMSGKATELLTFEEEKTKLQNKVKLNREKLNEARKEAEAVNMKLSKTDSAIQLLEMELQKEKTAPVEEMERKLQQIVQERETISEMKENGMNELENMIIEYYQSLFDAGLKEEEMKVVNEEVVAESQRMEGLQKAKAEAVRRKAEAMEAMAVVNYSGNCFVSDKMEAHIFYVQMCVAEMNLLLEQL